MHPLMKLLIAIGIIFVLITLSWSTFFKLILTALIVIVARDVIVLMKFMEFYQDMDRLEAWTEVIKEAIDEQSN